MKEIHVECKPDEVLVKKLGYTAKAITHHYGKAKVFDKLKKSTNLIAMVDEDPGSAKSTYEKELIFVEEVHGVKVYKDTSDNKIVVLKVKLEDWIINACKQSNIDISKFNLPVKANDLHSIINSKLSNFDKLINKLLSKNNPSILRLKESLN